MPANEAFAYYEPGCRITAKASATVVGKRLLKISGNRTSGPLVNPVQASDTTEGGVYQVAHAAASTDAIVGVAGWDAASGELVPVISEGVVSVTSGAAITAGVPVMSDAAGKVIAATAANRVIGIAMTGVGGADLDAEIKLTLGNAANT